jgi:hypothetical protein
VKKEANTRTRALTDNHTFLFLLSLFAAFTPPKTLAEVICFLRESRECFQLLHGKTPSLITLFVVERQRDQKRTKRRSLRHPIPILATDKDEDDDNDDDSSGIDEAPIILPRLLNRWSCESDSQAQDNDDIPPHFQYIVQSPSTISTSTNHF